MLYVYVLYVVLSGLLLAFFHRSSWKEWLVAMALVVLLPVIGWTFAAVWPKQAIKNEGGLFGSYMNGLDEDILIHQDAVHSKVNIQKELDAIPIEEALLVNDHVTRRRVMIDVLKEDAGQYMKVLRTAVQNEDTETSHYAVSAIMEVKRKLSLALQRSSSEYVREPDSLQAAQRYRDVLKQYMDSGYLDDRTLRSYEEVYLRLLDQIIMSGTLDINRDFEEKMECEMKRARYTEAEQTGIAYLTKFPDREEPYLRLVELYYTTKSPNSMHRMIQALKESDTVLTNHGLTLVRYWSEGISTS